MKMKVKATNNYEKFNVEDKELKRIPKEGEVFEVTEERYKVLSGENKWKVAFVEEVKELEEVKNKGTKKSTKKKAEKSK